MPMPAVPIPLDPTRCGDRRCVAAAQPTGLRRMFSEILIPPAGRPLDLAVGPQAIDLCPIGLLNRSCLEAGPEHASCTRGTESLEVEVRRIPARALGASTLLSCFSSSFSCGNDGANP